MYLIREIIEKLKDIVSKELDNKTVTLKDISVALKIDYASLRKQKSRNVIPYPEIMSFLAKRNISINWFFFNQLPESLIEETSNYIILKYQRTIRASAGGGAINYEVNSIPLVVDKQLLEHINSSYKYTEVLHALGESMEPTVKDGSLLFVDKSQTNINTTDIYLVRTNDGLFIKNIKMKNNKIVLISKNKDYMDCELHVDEVVIIGKACGILIKI